MATAVSNLVPQLPLRSHPHYYTHHEQPSPIPHQLDPQHQHQHNAPQAQLKTESTMSSNALSQHPPPTDTLDPGPIQDLPNKAAYLPSPQSHPFVILPTPPLPPPLPSSLLIRTRAVSINPVDGLLQHLPPSPPPGMHLAYPAILGQDAAGEVVAIGESLAQTGRLKVGDRVAGHCVGFASGRSQEWAFQGYVELRGAMVTRLPDGMGWERGVVLPLGCSTAAAGMFQGGEEGLLGLRLPGVGGEGKEEEGGREKEVVLVWGGSSSVGCNAVQLGVAAGYEVITTASPRNFEYLRGLGASQVFDRNSEGIRDELLAALKGKRLAGTLDCIGGDGWHVCLDVARQAEGSKTVVTTKHGYPAAPEGMRIRQMIATTIMNNGIGKAIYEDFLPRALEKGTFLPAPEPFVVGKGLESIQYAVDLYGKGGISAQKLVVLLDD